MNSNDYMFRMVDGDTFRYFDFDDIRLGYVNVSVGGISTVIVEMDTGIMDSDGWSIFAGDIVKFRVWDHFWIEGEAEVYYSDGCFRLNKNHPLTDYFKDGGTVTVVGNIHGITKEVGR